MGGCIAKLASGEKNCDDKVSEGTRQGEVKQEIEPNRNSRETDEKEVKGVELKLLRNQRERSESI